MNRITIVNPQLLKLPEYAELALISEYEYSQCLRAYYQFELVKRTVAFLNGSYNQVICKAVDNE